jgi:hypothetical protein
MAGPWQEWRNKAIAPYGPAILDALLSTNGVLSEQKDWQSFLHHVPSAATPLTEEGALYSMNFVVGLRNFSSVCGLRRRSGYVRDLDRLGAATRERGGWGPPSR